MRRREFIKILSGGAAWPLAATAQQLTGMPYVVRLAPVENRSQVEFIRRLLSELGYIEGRNIRLEFRDAAGNLNALPGIAQELVRAGVDVILASSTPAALAAYTATQSIPIVAFVPVDPVAAGLADSLGHPGRNVTGMTAFSEESTVKRVELMREVVPGAVRLGTVTTKVTSGGLAPLLEAGGKLGFSVEPINIDDPSDLARALRPEVLARFDALVFVPDIIIDAHIAEVIKLIDASNKPAIFATPDWVANGGFMSYGPDFSDATRRWISQLDRVLKGAKPGDLPFERPTKIDLTINLRVAKVLGIDLSPSILARADKVIE